MKIVVGTQYSLICSQLPDDMDQSEKKIMDFLQLFKDSMETKITETRDEIEATNRKIDGRLTGIEEEVKKVNEKIVASDKAGARMDARLSALEVEMKNSSTIRRRSNELRKQEEQLNNDRENAIHPEKSKQRFQASGSSKDINTKVAEVTMDILEQPVGLFRSSWAKNMEKELMIAAEQANKKKDIENVDKETDWIENPVDDKVMRRNQSVMDVPDRWEDRIYKKKTPKVRKPLKIEKWFGVDSETDSNDDTDDTEWLEVDRKKRSEMKKKQQNKKKKELEVLTARKASNMVGLGPIDLEEIERDRRNRVPFEESKLRIVKQILADRLDYDELELEELEIKETRLNPKGDGVIYMALGDQEQVKDIHKRKAEMQDDELIVRMYIPPNYYERFAHLNRVCKERREEDDTLKTQLRFGRNDLELFVKTKGDEAPYRQVPLEEFTDIEQVPIFDHKIKWKYHVDKPPRRAAGSRDSRDHRSQDPARQKKTQFNPLVRQHSTDDRQLEKNKKTRLNSRSSDEEMSDQSENVKDQPTRSTLYPVIQ